MYVSMYVCTLFCRCMQVCACHISLQSITLLLAHSPLFLLLLLLSLLLLFLAAVVAVAADDHIAAISAALVAAVAAAATAFAAAVTAAVWCCCCLVLLLLLLRVGMHPPAYTGKTMYRHTKIHTYIRQTNKQIDKRTFYECPRHFAQARWRVGPQAAGDRKKTRSGALRRTRRASKGLRKAISTRKIQAFRKILCSTSCYLASPKKTPSSRPFLRDVSNGLLVFIRKSNQPSGPDWFR